MLRTRLVLGVRALQLSRAIFFNQPSGLSVRFVHSPTDVEDVLGSALSFPPGLSPRQAYEHLVSKKQVSRDSKQLKALDSLEALYQQLLRSSPPARSANEIAAAAAQASKPPPSDTRGSGGGGFFGLFSRKSSTASSQAASSSSAVSAVASVLSPASTAGPHGVYLYGSPGCGKVNPELADPSRATMLLCCYVSETGCPPTHHLADVPVPGWLSRVCIPSSLTFFTAPLTRASPRRRSSWSCFIGRCHPRSASAARTSTASCSMCMRDCTGCRRLTGHRSGQRRAAASGLVPAWLFLGKASQTRWLWWRARSQRKRSLCALMRCR